MDTVKSKPDRRRGTNTPKDSLKAGTLTDFQLCVSEKHLFWIVTGLLFLFGLSHSIFYFGHQQVPNPDFTGFMSVGHRLWAFEIPDNYKRAPLLGLLAIPLGRLVGGEYPDLTGGWLLNAIIHPFNVVLLWLVCRRVTGRAGLWIAMAAIISPQVIYLVTEPIAETLLLFFVLLSFHLMFERSRWVYLAAALSTMVRYEGAALIAAAFLLDIVNARDWRARWTALGFSVAASVPLLLWILGTVMHWDQQGSGHYLKLLYIERFRETPTVLYQLWSVAIGPFLVLPPGMSDGVTSAILKGSMVLAGLLPAVSIAASVYRRRWDIIALLIFFVPYMIIHIMYEFTVPRFYATVHWILLVLCWHGAAELWALTAGRLRIPRGAVCAAQAVVGLVLLIWTLSLAEYLPRLEGISPHSYYMPYLGYLTVLLLGAAGFYAYRLAHWDRRLLAGVLMVGLITANQFRLAPLLGHGDLTVEFKEMAQWYVKNAGPGRIVCSMSNVMQIFVPTDQKKRMVHPANVQAKDPADFVRKCAEKNIRYVAWDSRIGYLPNDVNYKAWGIRNFAMLSQPRDIGPYRFIRKFENPHNKYRYIHLFEITAHDP